MHKQKANSTFLMTYLNAYKQLNNQLFDFCQFSNAVIVGAMASKKFSKVLNFIDPLLIYVVVVYGLTKVCENIFAVESVWQVLWDKLQIVLGKLVGFLSINIMMFVVSLKVTIRSCTAWCFSIATLIPCIGFLVFR